MWYVHITAKTTRKDYLLKKIIKKTVVCTGYGLMSQIRYV